jgi:hypothetical protein
MPPNGRKSRNATTGDCDCLKYESVAEYGLCQKPNMAHAPRLERKSRCSNDFLQRDVDGQRHDTGQSFAKTTFEPFSILAS